MFLKWCSRALVALLVAGAVARSQGALIPNPFFPIFDLKEYLGLSDDQYAKLVQNISDYNQMVNTRQQRMYQVQSEIRDETAKSPLDPMALGVRYAEVETICRNIREEANGLADRNKAILTDAQKVKLKALEDAYKLFPLISQAQSASLLGAGSVPLFPAFVIPANRITPAASLLLGSPQISGCQSQLVFRSGDFSVGGN